jgi:hypothetical protein
MEWIESLGKVREAATLRGSAGRFVRDMRFMAARILFRAALALDAAVTQGNIHE